MKSNFFHLQVIPVAGIIPHENFDQKRTQPLVASLKTDKCLINPIVVTPFEDGKYLQLDGMNRYSAFKTMGLSTIVTQIIDYNDQQDVELSSWVHLFSGKYEELFRYIKQKGDVFINEANLKGFGHRYIKEEGKGWLCAIIAKNGKASFIYTNGNLVQKVEQLNTLVGFWERGITRDLLPPLVTKYSLDILFGEHPGTNFMTIFPTFTRHQIVDVVRSGHLFPSGLTRHIIKRRCLNVNIPLSFFTGNKSHEELNEKLAALLMKKNYRVYEEPTIYFE